MKVSGKVVAEAILKKLAEEIKQKNLKPGLAIILAGSDSSSRIYVTNKIKAASRVGIEAKLYEFSEDELGKCLEMLDKLNKDSSVHGVIIQHPVYSSWNYDALLEKLDCQKDVDGFKEDSPFSGATALAVWEMLTAFGLIEGLPIEKFLENKKIVLLGRGRSAGFPTFKLLKEKGLNVESVVKETENPNLIIKSADVVISATGVKHIINKSNLKKGVYVVGVGVGKEVADGQEKTFGDINEQEVAEIAKLYCPTIGGIGPLTIVSLLKNVVESSKKEG